MIRDLSPLNPLTASCNAIHQGILATSHVILERDKVTQFLDFPVVFTIWYNDERFRFGLSNKRHEYEQRENGR